MKRWLRQDTARRRLAIAVGIYALATAVYFAFAARDTLLKHTQWNHFSLLAEAWIDGRLHLDGAPPAYAGNNDFAKFDGNWFVTFPPFPAVLLVPLVWWGGSAERVQDGQFFIWLAGIGPGVLFLALEKLRRTGRGGRSTRDNLILSLLFAFGTVYFFTAEQGTVWYAAHVVGVALAALYLLFALDAERPILAGLMLGLGFMTRSPLIFAFPLFAYEAFRVCTRPRDAQAPSELEQLELPLSEGAQLDLPLTGSGPPTRSAVEHVGRVSDWWRRLDKARLGKLAFRFALPLVLVLAVALRHNAARFGDPFDFGYEHLQIAWRGRMEQWGLFHYHYLAKNLGVMLTSLPYLTKPGAEVPFQINAHGLALWVTTPLYLFLLWPRRRTPLWTALWVTVALVAIPTLFYQNTGWVQFGYRFSNDYAVFLFALLAIGGYRFRVLFFLLATWSVGVNAFGARTFNRADHSKYYFQDNTQRILYQPDR